MSSFARKSEQEHELPALTDGRYDVERSLGRGGMAQVFRVRCRASGQLLALKRLSRRASGNLAALFELEYQVLASIRHPSVVRAFTFGRDGEHAYYTMELLEGEDLKSARPSLGGRRAPTCVTQRRPWSCCTHADSCTATLALATCGVGRTDG